jgi:peroxiredoxin
LPEFIEAAKVIKEKGVSEILGMAVNDPFVMTAFA